jgi:hypothetical protein
MAHHKNELAGRTRRIIDFTSPDRVLAKLLLLYLKSARPLLHSGADAEVDELLALEGAGAGPGGAGEGAGRLAAADGGDGPPAAEPPRRRRKAHVIQGRPSDYLFLSLPTTSVGSKRVSRCAHGILAWNASLMRTEVQKATKAAFGEEGFGPRRMRNLAAAVVPDLKVSEAYRDGYYAVMGTSRVQIDNSYDLDRLTDSVKAVATALLSKIEEHGAAGGGPARGPGVAAPASAGAAGTGTGPGAGGGAGPGRPRLGGLALDGGGGVAAARNAAAARYKPPPPPRGRIPPSPPAEEME